MGFLTPDRIDLPALVAAVSAPERGGVVTFHGLVRDHHAGRRVLRLEYHAYAPMVEAECGRIMAEAEDRWPCRVILRHRTGGLAIGDTAIAIVTAAAHRGEAFDACRYVIEAVKRRVPIWKREYYADGTEAWVDPTAPGGTVAAGSP